MRLTPGSHEDAQPINYTIRRHPRAKRVRILIGRDRAIRVSMPKHFSDRVAERFVADKAEWIYSVLGRLPVTEKPTANELRQQAKVARALAHQLTDEYSRRYGFRVAKISIRHQRTRWGSCTEKGNISFNARMSTLPENLQRYIVVHELAHTKEHNHSSKFWSLVESILPDYRTQRATLRQQSLV